MKALLIESDNGVEYDGYEHWVSAVFVVPDDFNPLKIRNRVIESARTDGIIRLTKRGEIYQKDWSKINNLYNEYLKANFQQLEIFEYET